MTNIILGAVGGQGLVLTTRIICEAALKAGFDVKSNDVVGLSQRGGKIWGSVRFGERIWSPNIPEGEADILVGLEALEGLRWSRFLRPGGLVVLNTLRIPPVPVMMETAAYPEDILQQLQQRGRVIAVDAVEIARAAGNVKAANTVLLGLLARETVIPVSLWEACLKELVPKSAIEANLRAFSAGWEGAFDTGGLR